MASGKEFVQMGWYVGNASQLPYTTTPRVWVGESDSIRPPNYEYLRAFMSVSPSSYHRYRIQWDGQPGEYQFYLDGVLIATTLTKHVVGLTWEGAFNGETHVCGGPMNAIASYNGPTLQTGVNTAGGPGTYKFFHDDYFVRQASGDTYSSFPYNDTYHTDWARGYRLK